MFLLHVDLKNIDMPKMTLSWIIAVRQFIDRLCSSWKGSDFSDKDVEDIGILEKDDPAWCSSVIPPPEAGGSHDSRKTLGPPWQHSETFSLKHMLRDN